MSIDSVLLERAHNICELCTSIDNLCAHEVAPEDGAPEGSAVVLCAVCSAGIASSDLNSNHWQCLSTSMWSPVPAVQVLAWRLLTRLSGESWAQDLLDMMYLDENLAAWAQAGLPEDTVGDRAPARDSNGAPLMDGDSVTLIKDLAVKGAGFTAKRGTLVRNISLTDNPLHIEGRVNGQQIVLVSAFLKKA